MKSIIVTILGASVCTHCRYVSLERTETIVVNDLKNKPLDGISSLANECVLELHKTTLW